MKYPPHQCCWGFRIGLLHLMSKLRCVFFLFCFFYCGTESFISLGAKPQLWTAVFLFHDTIQLCAKCTMWWLSRLLSGDLQMCEQPSILIDNCLWANDSSPACNKATWISNAVIAPVELDQRRPLLMGQAPSHPLLLNDKNLKTTDVINALFSEFGLQSNNYFHSSWICQVLMITKLPLSVKCQNILKLNKNNICHSFRTRLLLFFKPHSKTREDWTQHFGPARIFGKLYQYPCRIEP